MSVTFPWVTKATKRSDQSCITGLRDYVLCQETYLSQKKEKKN
jgi:hypothetical protein